MLQMWTSEKFYNKNVNKQRDLTVLLIETASFNSSEGRESGLRLISNDADIVSTIQNYGDVQSKAFLAPLFFNAERDVSFHLYTTTNPTTKTVVTISNFDLIGSSNFNKFLPTRIIIHGWRSNAEGEINTVIRSAYIQKRGFNIISVDWSRGAALDIFSSRSCIPDVGRIVARFIDLLNEKMSVPFNSIYLIGHSFGAHVAGFSGKYVTRGRIQTIYGLDPAGPLFSYFLPEQRLSVTDADYVQVIHTSSVGILENIGSADFYPNYGTQQPGCLLMEIGCSHNRAYVLFAETINSPRFIGQECRNYKEVVYFKTCQLTGGNSYMGGEPSDSGKKGVFYLTTDSVPPY